MTAKCHTYYLKILFILLAITAVAITLPDHRTVYDAILEVCSHKLHDDKSGQGVAPSRFKSHLYTKLL